MSYMRLNELRQSRWAEPRPSFREDMMIQEERIIQSMREEPPAPAPPPRRWFANLLTKLRFLLRKPHAQGN